MRGTKSGPASSCEMSSAPAMASAPSTKGVRDRRCERLAGPAAGRWTAAGGFTVIAPSGAVVGPNPPNHTHVAGANRVARSVTARRHRPYATRERAEGPWACRAATTEYRCHERHRDLRRHGRDRGRRDRDRSSAAAVPEVDEPERVALGGNRSVALPTPSSVELGAAPVVSRRGVRVAHAAVIVAGAGLAVVVGHDGAPLWRAARVLITAVMTAVAWRAIGSERTPRRVAAML